MAALLLAYCSTLQAQHLDTLLAAIPRENPELKALELEYRAALQVAPQVDQLPDPDLKLGWYVQSPETRLGPQRLWWIFNQKLPWPGKLNAQRELALARAAPALEKMAARRLVLERQLKIAWHELYRIERKQEYLEEHLEIYKGLERLALSKLESNQGTGVEVYRVQAAYNELAYQMRQLEFDKAKPQAEINRILGRPANAGITPQGIVGVPELPLNLEDLMTRITTDHPAIRILELQQEVSRRALEVNRLESKPDFTVGLDYFLVGKRVDADPAGNGRDILMPHVMVTIPLNKDKYRAKEQEEALRVQALDQYQLDQLNNFRAMVEVALSDYRAAREEVTFLDDQAYLMRAMMRLAQSDYEQNKRSFEEVMKILDSVTVLEERHLMAELDTVLAMVDLQFYLLF